MTRICFALVPYTMILFGCSENEKLPRRPVCELLDHSGYADTPANRFISSLDVEEGLTDLWGYVDVETNTEYILLGYGPDEIVGGVSGIHIINVNDPAQPELVSSITNVGGRDLKTWQHYVYSVAGSERAPGKIASILDINNPVDVGNFPGSHNIFITCDGLLITADPGIKIYDLTVDPATPELIWEDEGEGGHDVTVTGQYMYDVRGFNTRIYDLTTPQKPKLLSTIDMEFTRSTHSVWPDENENFLYIAHENNVCTDERLDLTIWDITDKASPTFVGSFCDPNATMHNLQIVKNKIYFSYYTAGYRVMDITDPFAPVIIYEFDTAPDAEGKGGLEGAFGVYALSPSGHVYVSDVENGLFIFGR